MLKPMIGRSCGHLFTGFGMSPHGTANVTVTTTITIIEHHRYGRSTVAMPVRLPFRFKKRITSLLFAIWNRRSG